MPRKSKETTRKGFLNPNRQRNNGRTDPPLRGNMYNQFTYILECLDCGNIYGANGCDISLRKCPNCQGGARGLVI